MTGLSPREVLFQYFQELLQLNEYAMAKTQAAKEQGEEPNLDDLRTRRAAIRQRYCTKRKRKTDNVVAYGALDTLAYSAAHLTVEKEDRESDTRYRITIHNRALGERWRYLLVLREGRWLIDSLQMREGRKWSPVPLH